MSSDINFNINDLTDSQSAAQKIGETFYPDGREVYTNTTQSTDDISGRTLTSADPVKILQGDGIYRNPAFAINGYIQNVQSAMHGIIATAGDIDDNVKILDPSDPSGTTFLTGASARQEIAKQSLLTTGYAPGGFESTMQDLINSNSATDSSSSGKAGVSNSTTGQITTDQRNNFNAQHQRIHGIY